MKGQLQQRLGANVRTLRRSRGLSQEGLAELLDVHRTYAGTLERGERNLSLRALERLADALDVDPLWLLSEPEEADRKRR